MASNDRDRLIQTFMARTNTGRRKRKPGSGSVSPPASARFSRSSATPPNNGQSYVSQGQAVENAANARNYTQGRARADRERSQQNYRHALGYDKPGITAKGVKRKAKKVLHKVNPFD